MGFRIFLEKSYSEADIPDKFYVSIRFDSAALKSQSLTGLTGITANKSTALTFWGKGKCLLEMNGKEVLKLNRLSRIMYDNPDYTASKFGSVVHRVAGPADINLYGTESEKDRLLLFAKRIVTFLYGSFGFVNFPSSLVDDIANYALKYKVNSVMGYVKIIMPLIKNTIQVDQFTQDKVQHVVNQVFRDNEHFRKFAVEQEWLVKPDYTGGQIIFRVPRGSNLYMLTITMEDFQNQLQIVERTQLDSIYNVIYCKNMGMVDIWRKEDIPTPVPVSASEPKTYQGVLPPGHLSDEPEPKPQKRSWLKMLGVT